MGRGDGGRTRVADAAPVLRDMLQMLRGRSPVSLAEAGQVLRAYERDLLVR